MTEQTDAAEVAETRCPTCGSDGVKACVDEQGRELSYDHDGRPPYFDARATAALDSMARAAAAAARGAEGGGADG